ncbi:hypothetical protein [Saccharopolyspora mangrovi]|uniref:Uncharacterized protein n=1 Tax=Saccharopolyspora mangrovi TaxID=3082379 RepID=A0ABU6ABX6_9PSEU|nr:hypothetical protein [Saccharopolyspora sp. S2-29]MEB3368971.1 hypothetical protein [Saccharopolyspora sp. S2-29]
MLRTEVTVSGAGTWVFTTARTGVDPATGKEEYETTVSAPCCQSAKPIRRCLTEQRARQVHQTLVDEFAATESADTEIRSWPWP